MSRKKTFITIFTIVLALGLTGGAIGLYLYFKPIHKIDEDKPDYSFTAEALGKDFSSGSTAADKKYEHKILEINGRISAIEIDKMKNVNLMLKAGDVTIQCSFLDTYNQKASSLKEGADVRLKGNYIGWENDIEPIIKMSNCIIL
jgi:hypothetical protein